MFNRFIDFLFGNVGLKVMKQDYASQVIFFGGAEVVGIDNAYVTVYEGGLVHIDCFSEVSTTHLTNCEIIWEIRGLEDESEGALDQGSTVVSIRGRNRATPPPAPPTDDDPLDAS